MQILRLSLNHRVRVKHGGEAVLALGIVYLKSSVVQVLHEPLFFELKPHLDPMVAIGAGLHRDAHFFRLLRAEVPHRDHGGGR